jgi:hypothetical protein
MGRFNSRWIAAYRRPLIVGSIAGGVNLVLGLVLVGIFAAPLLAIPVGILAGQSILSHPRFAKSMGDGGVLAGLIAGLPLLTGSILTGPVFATLSSAIEAGAPASTSTLLPWSPELYLTFTLVGFVLGIVALGECMVIGTIVQVARGRINRPVPTLPAIYEEQRSL